MASTGARIKMRRAKGKEPEEEDEVSSVKRLLENGNGDGGSTILESSRLGVDVDSLPPRFLERLTMYGLQLHLVQPGLIICFMKIPPRLVDSDNRLHEGTVVMLVDALGSAVIYTVGSHTTTGVSVEISVSFFDSAYLDEDVEIESRVLQLGKTILAITVELRKKDSGKVIALGRHTRYLPASSKL